MSSAAAGPSTADATVVHGMLVLHARSGNLLFSRRISPAFGLTTCEQLARDEMRLGAMLFAIHLNADATCATKDGSGLSTYQLDNVAVQFCRSTVTDSLLVLMAPAALGASAGFLAAEMLRRFEICFEDSLRRPTQHGAFKRQAFAASFREAIVTFHGWCLERVLADVGCRVPLPPAPAAPSSLPSPSSLSMSPQLQLDAVASLHSAAICNALDLPAAKTAAADDEQSKPRKPSRVARTTPSSPPLPLLSILGMSDGAAVVSERRRRRFFCCGCLPAHAIIKPKLKAPPPLVLPLSFACDHTTPKVSKAAVTAGADLEVQHLVREVHAASQQRSLRAAAALYTAPTAEGSVVVLLRAPMVLRVRVTLAGAAAGGKLAPADEAWLASAVAALAAALQPWVAPLALSLAFLGSRG